MPSPDIRLPDSARRFSARPGIYAITGEVPELPLEDIARAMLKGGAPVVQIRAKHATGQRITQAAAALMPLFDAADSLLIINDDVKAARDSCAHGVHLGQGDLDPRVAREMLGPHAILGYSTHHAGQVEQALRWHEASGGMLFSYLAFGPLFPTATKHDADPVTGTAILREIRTMWPGPLVGIGGITIASMAELAAAGLTRPALISALMAHTSDGITSATARMHSAWQQALESR